jgi:poly(3-hydroxybutyrate) depolymerase
MDRRAPFPGTEGESPARRFGTRCGDLRRYETLLYNAYELQRAMLGSAATWASVASEMFSNPALPIGYTGVGPIVASALEVFAHAAMPRGKPGFGIEHVTAGGEERTVVEAIVHHKPFGNLVRFDHDGLPQDAPNLLIVAPMSGHYASLLRGTVTRMLRSARVYITDWADAKMVPAEAGRFDLDDYIDYLIEFLEHIGPGTHVLAVCQPSVPALAAAAVMSKASNPARPATLTMMGGPVDTREAPTSVNDLAMQKPLSWFENHVIATVPMTYPGAGRQVYPGFLQLAGFMSMNIEQHVMSHYAMFRHLVDGDGESAAATKAFYDEYRSVCDLTAEFYLQTIDQVFQRHALPKGEFVHRGEPVDLGAIQDIGILAIEGEKDDISGLGQTRASLKLTGNLPDDRKRYYMAKNVGHYGIFNGSKWRDRIAPVLEDWIASGGRAQNAAAAA